MADTFKEDMELVRVMMEKFITQEHISKGLKQIHDIDIPGWEKWWQVELAIFLDEYPNIIEWDMEHEFEIDRRKYDGDSLYVDIGFTMDGWSDSYVFLELKQNKDYKKCIDAMFKDAEKYELLKSKSMDGVKMRSVFVVGLFLKSMIDDVQSYFKSCIEHYEFEMPSDEYLFLHPASSEWTMLVF